MLENQLCFRSWLQPNPKLRTTNSPRWNPTWVSLNTGISKVLSSLTFPGSSRERQKAKDLVTGSWGILSEIPPCSSWFRQTARISERNTISSSMNWKNTIQNYWTRKGFLPSANRIFWMKNSKRSWKRSCPRTSPTSSSPRSPKKALSSLKTSSGPCSINSTLSLQKVRTASCQHWKTASGQ